MTPSGWKKELARALPQARWEEPLAPHTTFRIGGPAECYVEAERPEDLAALFGVTRPGGVPVFMLGWGSNLLVLDGGVRGVVLRLKGGFDRLRRLEGRGVWAGAAVRLPRLVSYCAAHDLAGSEPLVGVPGTVGGALVMNAGTRQGEIGGLVREVELFDTERLASALKKGSELGFGYRRSELEGSVVTGVSLELNPGDKVDILRRVQELQAQRLRTQPVHTYNVGSVFKNPPGRFVAQLIEEAGLKGTSLGGARISPKHANFIENHRGATAADVLGLVEQARRAVRLRHGVELELEMKIVGEPLPAAGSPA